MSDKVNVDDIIGLVKTDEVIDGVEEVRKLRGRGETMSNESIVRDYRLKDDGTWEQLIAYEAKDGEVKEWCGCTVVDVSVERLLLAWESLIVELSLNEVELLKLKEYIQSESFHLETTVDFKELYGKNNADIRKHHIKTELADVFDEVQSLELSINWIKGYVPLLRECIKVKRD